MARIKHYPALLALCALVVACGQLKAPPANIAAVAQVDGIVISEPRLRAPPQGRDMTAGYFILENTTTTSKQLIGIKSPLAKRVELHDHVVGTNNMMQMRKINDVVIPAKSTILFAPAGIHIMLFELSPLVKEGTKLPITLKFLGGAEATFDLPVVNNPSDNYKDEKARDRHQH